MQHPLPEQRKAGPAIPLAFEEFEPINLPLGLTAVPLQCEGCFHGGLIASNASRKSLKFSHATRLGTP